MDSNKSQEVGNFYACGPAQKLYHSFLTLWILLDVQTVDGPAAENAGIPQTDFWMIFRRATQLVTAVKNAPLPLTI